MSRIDVEGCPVCGETDEFYLWNGSIYECDNCGNMFDAGSKNFEIKMIDGACYITFEGDDKEAIANMIWKTKGE